MGRRLNRMKPANVRRANREQRADVYAKKLIAEGMDPLAAERRARIAYWLEKEPEAMTSAEHHSKSSEPWHRWPGTSGIPCGFNPHWTY